MPKINDLRCSLCGKEHEGGVVTELVANGWFAIGVSKTGGYARRLICPECLQRAYGREVSPDEFRVPE